MFNLPVHDFYDKKTDSPRNERRKRAVPAPRGVMLRAGFSNIFIAEAELI